MAIAAAATKVITNKVRLSYTHLFEAHATQEGQDKKFSTVILVPKTDKATIKKIRDAQQAALLLGKDKKFNGSIPKQWKDTFHDGDEEGDLEKNPEYAGHYYMTVSNKTRPGVVDQSLNPIIDSTELYSGAYARVSINCYPFAAQGNKGVSFGLNNVQKLADGEPLGGVSAKAEDEFEAVSLDEQGDDLI